MNNTIKILITMLLFASAIFCADIIFTGGAFSSFYVCVVLLSLWSDDDRLLIGGTIGSIVLIFAAYGYFLFNTYDSSSALSATATFGLAGFINKLVSAVMISITAGLAARSKEKSQTLKRLNETLELRVLARIASSEAKAHRLEGQIKILQEIRQSNTDSAFSALDEVITNLKVLAVERRDSSFEGLK